MGREYNELSLPTDKLEDKGNSIKDSLLQFFLTLLSKHRFQGQTSSFWSRVKHQNTTSNNAKQSCSIDLISLAPGPCCGVELVAKNTSVSRPVIWRSVNVHHLSGSCVCSVNGFKLSTRTSVNWHVLNTCYSLGSSISGGNSWVESSSYWNFEITENLKASWLSWRIVQLQNKAHYSC